MGPHVDEAIGRSYCANDPWRHQAAVKSLVAFFAVWFDLPSRSPLGGIPCGLRIVAMVDRATQ
jgi:hypothetical protein